MTRPRGRTERAGRGPAGPAGRRPGGTPPPRSRPPCLVWIAAPILTAGLIAAALAGYPRPTASPLPPHVRPHGSPLPTAEALVAELERDLELHRVCTQTGLWLTWPCSRWPAPTPETSERAAPAGDPLTNRTIRPQAQ